jgi:hypothetical protein
VEELEVNGYVILPFEHSRNVDMAIEHIRNVAMAIEHSEE